jgi:hypothetical protein
MFLNPYNSLSLEKKLVSKELSPMKQGIFKKY